MVPDATFTSYYGRPVVKASPWAADIPAYLFLGGLAGGSSLLAAGADRTDRPALRRTGRIGAMVAITGSFVALVADLGRPGRFANMLRVAKPTSPMSVGTWFLTAFGPAAGLAGAGELSGLLPARWRGTPAIRWLQALTRPAGMAAALVAPGVASYTAVLLSDTATPTWHAGRGEMPFVFVGSAAAAAGGLGMLGAPVDQAGPARRMAVAGALVDLAAAQRMEASMGRLMRASKALTGLGAAATAVFGARSRAVSAMAGAAFLAGSACTRFGIFEAGQASARDPKYTVVPQRRRLEQSGSAAPSR
jgi:formate-dependent nitrite reductase membrane component NrfD